MSLRAVLLGFLLGLCVSAATYFNDHVVRQPVLVGSHLPPAVFGVFVLLAFAVNPLLPRRGAMAGLRPAELALIVAIGLAACWAPGGGFYRQATPSLAMPAHLLPQNPAWLGNDVMAYVPGAAPLLADGFVRDWDALQRGLAERGSPFLRRLWPALDEASRAALASEARLTHAERRAVVRALNRALADPALGEGTTEGRRAALEAALPGVLTPPPRGEGVLPLEGRADPRLTARFVTGGGDVPWTMWWPAIRLWGGVALCGALASLCVAVIVHPQWSRRELLPYPVARLVADAAATHDGRRLPAVAHHPMFRWGFLGVLALQAVNVAHAWQPALPTVPMQLDFSPMAQLFPTASQVPMADGLLQPRIIPSAIAFTFYLQSRVTLSLGLSLVGYVMLQAAMVSRGLPVPYGESEPALRTMLRFGAWLAAGVTIVYVGRTYYAKVLAAAVGRGRLVGEERASVWAARALPLLAGSAAWLLWRHAGLDPLYAMLLIGLVLLGELVLARIVAECGVYFVTVAWAPTAVFLGLVGYDAVDPTSMLVLMLLYFVLAKGAREAVMPFAVNALYLGDRAAGAGPGRTSPLLAAMLVAGFLVAGYATLTTQYALGVDYVDRWASLGTPSELMDAVANQAERLRETGVLGESVAAGAGPARWAMIRPSGEAVAWLAVGAAAYGLCAAARLRLPWWPLHPVLFLFLGTYASHRFAFSLLLGWAIKAAVAGVAGEAGAKALRPLAVGVIAAELLAAVLQLAAGAAYYAATGLTPPRVPELF